MQKRWKYILVSISRFINRLLPHSAVVSDPALATQGRAYNRQRFFGPRPLFCYAPFRSVFISYDGRVSPCYACKAVDHVNDKRLEDVWNGPVFGDLRRSFRRGIIPDACSFCRGHLKNGNFGSILAAKYDYHSLPNRGYPSIVEFELGNECSLQCIMCSGELSSSIRSQREGREPVISVVDDRFHEHFEFCLPHLRAAEFTGGDPFLIPVYRKIWDRIEKVRPETDILITTNANTMGQHVEDLLSKDLKISFNISIDSLNKETYEKIRVNAVFEDVIRNIGIFAEYTRSRGTHVGFLVCPMKLNAYELPDFIKFAEKYGAGLSYHVVFKPAALALWTLEHKELQELHHHLVPHRFKGTGLISSQNARNYDALVELIRVWSEKALQRSIATKEKSDAVRELIARAQKEFWQKLSSECAEEDLCHHRARLEFLMNKSEISEWKDLVYIELSKMPAEEILKGFHELNDDTVLEKLKRYHCAVYYQIFAGEGLSDNDKYELAMKGGQW